MELDGLIEDRIELSEMKGRKVQVERKEDEMRQEKDKTISLICRHNHFVFSCQWVSSFSLSFPVLLFLFSSF